jgi:hypothetical protein
LTFQTGESPDSSGARNKKNKTFGSLIKRIYLYIVNQLKTNSYKVMGTRNLTMVVHKEETKIAQYGQWDGYPDGNGVTILSFLRSKARVKKLTDKLENVRFATEADYKKAYKFLKSIGCKDGWMNMDQAEKYHKAFPYRSRDIGASILELVANSKDKEIILTDSTDFAGDSLFCEWAYVVDLDKRKLEVYSGFNKVPTPEGERFSSIPKSKDSSEYYPIKCIQTFDLDKLPTKKQFLKVLKQKEEVEV